MLACLLSPSQIYPHIMEWLWSVNLVSNGVSLTALTVDSNNVSKGCFSLFFWILAPSGEAILVTSLAFLHLLDFMDPQSRFSDLTTIKTSPPS